MAKPKSKPKPERKPAKREPEPDLVEIAWRTVQETIGRSNEAS